MSAGQGLGIGTSVVGGELQGWAALLDKWAMQKAYQDEAARQQGFAQQGVGIFGGALGQSTPGAMQQGLQQGAQQRQQAYNDIGNVPLGSGFNPQSSYKGGADTAYTNMLGGARAQQGAYSDWALQQSINNLRNQQALQQVESFAGGQARNVFPLQMYAAQHANDAMAAIGQAISGIGGAAANYAQLYGQQPGGQQAPTYYPVNVGGLGGPAMWSGYGNYPPPGTSFNPYTDQSWRAG